MDDTKPVTVGDLRRELSGFVTKTELKAAVAELPMKAELAELEQRLLVQFEDLRHDVLGGLRDIQSLLKDKTADHERRIQRLETVAGLSA